MNARSQRGGAGLAGRPPAPASAVRGGNGGTSGKFMETPTIFPAYFFGGTPPPGSKPSPFLLRHQPQQHHQIPRSIKNTTSNTPEQHTTTQQLRREQCPPSLSCKRPLRGAAAREKSLRPPSPPQSRSPSRQTILIFLYLLDRSSITRPPAVFEPPLWGSQSLLPVLNKATSGQSSAGLLTRP